MLLENNSQILCKMKPYPTPFILKVIQFGAAALIISACSKSAPAPGQNDSQTKAATPTDVSTPGDSAFSSNENFQTAPAIASPGEAPAESAPAALERKYLATTDSDTRDDIVERLRDLDNAEAVQVLGRLFQAATDQDEKLDLIATLDQMDTEVGELPILANAIRPDQPQEVRAAAIDSLADLDEPGALQLLQGLTNDPDPTVRQAAKDALQREADAEKEPSR